MKNIIMSGFIDKGYTVTPEDFFCQLQVRYSPVNRFVWRVRVKAYEVDELLVGHIKDARYIFHEHSVSYHASLIFTIDIE